jgi:UrcA family protein
MAPVITRFILPLGLACALVATPALADPEGRSATVRTNDLNLATPAGEQVLRHRITRAIAVVCGDADLRDLAAVARQDACRATAMAKAMPQMQVAIANARTNKAYAVNDAKPAPAPHAS